jgi:hypothetical protein
MRHERRTERRHRRGHERPLAPLCLTHDEKVDEQERAAEREERRDAREQQRALRVVAGVVEELPPDRPGIAAPRGRELVAGQDERQRHDVVRQERLLAVKVQPAFRQLQQAGGDVRAFVGRGAVIADARHRQRQRGDDDQREESRIQPSPAGRLRLRGGRRVSLRFPLRCRHRVALTGSPRRSWSACTFRARRVPDRGRSPTP